MYMYIICTLYFLKREWEWMSAIGRLKLDLYDKNNLQIHDR